MKTAWVPESQHRREPPANQNSSHWTVYSTKILESVFITASVFLNDTMMKIAVLIYILDPFYSVSQILRGRYIISFKSKKIIKLKG